MKRITIVIIASLFFTYLNSQSALAKKTYVFGVHPFKSQTKLSKMFRPLINYLEEQLGAKIIFKRAKDYESAMNALIAGDVDISYMGPAPYAILDSQHPGKIRICAAVLNKGKTTFKGVIIAREDSGIKLLQDLKGKKFAFGSRKSTLSCYMPAHMLMEAGVFNSISYDFYGHHDKVAINVLRGKVDAGGLKPSVAKKYLGKGIKIIAESAPVYEHMIVVGPNVDSATYEKISSALLNVKDSDVYTSIKKSLTGFAKVAPSDYDNLKKVIKAVDAKMKK